MMETIYIALSEYKMPLLEISAQDEGVSARASSGGNLFVRNEFIIRCAYTGTPAHACAHTCISTHAHAHVQKHNREGRNSISVFPIYCKSIQIVSDLTFTSRFVLLRLRAPSQGVLGSQNRSSGELWGRLGVA